MVYQIVSMVKGKRKDQNKNGFFDELIAKREGLTATCSQIEMISKSSRVKIPNRLEQYRRENCLLSVFVRSTSQNQKK